MSFLSSMRIIASVWLVAMLTRMFPGFDDEFWVFSGTLFGVVWCLFDRDLRSADKGSVPFFALAAIALILVCLLPPRLGGEFGVVVFSLAVGLKLQFTNQEKASSPNRGVALCLATFPPLFVLGFSVLKFATPLLLDFTVIALGWGRLLSLLRETGISMGPTPQGIAVWGLLACVVTGRFLIGERRAWSWIVGLGGLTTLHVLWATCVAPLSLLQFGEGPLFLPLTYLLVSMTPVAVWCAQASRGITRPNPRPRWTLLGIGGIACLIASALTLTGPTTHRPSVVFYGENAGEILNWIKPEPGVYGAESMGMFGLLPDYLRADGFEVSLLNHRLEPGDLKACDVFVTINVNTEWSRKELEEIWEFVRTGGSLLVLADHTDVGGTQSSQNALLEPTGISLNFDSAMLARTRGWNDVDLALHPIVAGLKRDGHGIGVGASLRIQDSRAEIVAKSSLGFSDLGDASAVDRAFLGNYEYEIGERLGDIPLVAWAPMGHGKVLVFGDTSSFQNASLAATYKPLVQNTFTWMSMRQSGTTRFRTLLVVLGIGFLGFALRRFPRSPIFLSTLAIGASASVFGVEHSYQRTLDRNRGGENRIGMPHAWIDRSHGARIDDSELGKNQIGGLVHNLQRAGFFVQEVEEFPSQQWREGDVVVLLAPVSPYNEGEVQRLREFVKRGGLVVAASGYMDRGGVAPWLLDHGLAIDAVPVGPVPLKRDPYRERKGVEFFEAWPIRWANPNDVASGKKSEAGGEIYQNTHELEVLSHYEGLPLAILLRCGRGGIFFVGDSSFFGTENLESHFEFSEPNIELLARVFTQFRKWNGSS